MCSVLFCDLVGFTPLSEARDPEAVRELLSEYSGWPERWSTATAGWSRSSSVMRSWRSGVLPSRPRTTPNGRCEPRSSWSSRCRARRRTRRPGLAARAGVVTGEVAVSVGAVGEGMVTGDAVNTASRIQGAADPGAVLVDETTRESPAAGSRSITPAATISRASRSRSGFGARAACSPALAGRSGWTDSRHRSSAGTVRSASSKTSSTPRWSAGRRAWSSFRGLPGSASRGSDGSSRSTLTGSPGRSGGTGGVACPMDPGSRSGRSRRWCDSASGSLKRTHPRARRRNSQLASNVPARCRRAGYLLARLGRLLGVTYPGDGRDLPHEDLFAGWRLWLERLATAIRSSGHRGPAVRGRGAARIPRPSLDWTRDVPIFVLALARSESTSRPGLGAGRKSTA